MVSRDLYGGSFRYFAELEKSQRAFFDTFSTVTELSEKLTDEVTAVFLETPTNPLMTVTDIAETAKLAHDHGALLIVDNTFLTPLRQLPLEEGADLVIHSGRKPTPRKLAAFYEPIRRSKRCCTQMQGR